jgi:hypothetical protein
VVTLTNVAGPLEYLDRHASNHPGCICRAVISPNPWKKVCPLFSLLLSWSGGVPPYVVQQSTNLSAWDWQDAVSNAVPPVNFPLDQIAGYYRVTGH